MLHFFTPHPASPHWGEELLFSQSTSCSVPLPFKERVGEGENFNMHKPLENLMFFFTCTR